MDHPRPWLRYVDAGDLESSTYKFDGLEVDSGAGEKLGTVDGFVVDRDSGRPYYVVVDAGGWFKSKRFLLPIGHAGFDRARQRLISDVSRDRVDRFPGFDLDEFEKLSDDDLRRMDESIVASCCPAETTGTTTSVSRFETWTHYRTPDWWDSSFYRADNTRQDVGVSMPSRDDVRAERDRERRHDTDRDRELITARGGDTSPHPGGRAQPGDVIGVETGGERTSVGDTSKDENERRRDAERDAAKMRRD